MKKALKVFLILPLLVFSMFFLFACGEDAVRAVSISLPSTSSIVEDKGRYYLEYNSLPIQLNISLSPSNFSHRNITWKTTASNVAYVNSEGKLVMTGEGDVSIQAEYVNEDGSSVFSSVIKLNISMEGLPYFAQSSLSTTYAGSDIKENFTVRNAKEEIYDYVYYKIGGVGESGQQVDEIIDAGEYLITYVKRTTQTKYAEMTLNVSKYIISQNAPNDSSIFSEALPAKFFTATPTLADFKNGFEIKQGVGADAGKVIGWYLHRTSATEQSSVGIYPTSVLFQFDENYAKNYTLVSHSGIHEITPKEVVLVVKDQNITYGQALVANSYFLYDNAEYISNDNSLDNLSPLENPKLMASINPGNYIFLKNDNPIDKNEWGFIDAGAYDLKYNSALLSTDGNVTLSTILSGSLTVAKKAIIITPHISNDKIYTEQDNLASLKYSSSDIFPNNNEIQPFLTIDYRSDDPENPIVDYGEGNFRAPAGKYFYSLNNSKNKNFNFSLVENALGTYIGNSPIQFEVKKCHVAVLFEDIVSYYKTPLGFDAQNNPIPTVSYYSVTPDGASPNYELTRVLSMTINGVEQVVNGDLQCAADEFKDSGAFMFSTGEIFRIRLKLIEQTRMSNYFATYYVALKDLEADSAQNYTVSVAKSYVNLDKINVKIIPAETEEISSKVYTGDISIPNYFYQDYSTQGAIEEGVTISNIFGTELLLSLTDEDGSYNRLEPDGSLAKLDNIIDCGKYKIFLSKNLRYISGKEYYNFSLDSTKAYYFTVLQKQIIITPDSNQSKIYGNTDPMLTYTYGDSIANLPVTGKLIRVEGENFGVYKINLGTLSFGSNFNLSLSSTIRNFEIKKREITITPTSYITTFGDNFPLFINHNDPLEGQTYNQNILVRPSFSGNFKLEYDGIEIQKVGSYYPVKVVNEQIVPYVIKQGSFSCSNTNYEMTVTENSTYLVNKKEATLNISAKNITSTTGVSTSITNFLDYTIDSENGKENVTLSGISFTVIPLEDKYYIPNSNFSEISNLTIKLGGIDITDCYDLSLGNNVVYFINSTIINLSIVSNDQDNSPFVRKTFTGEVFEDLFKLVCLTEDYEIISENHLITYSTTNGSEVDPKDAGSYFVSMLVNQNLKIVLKRLSDEAEIEFSALGEKVNGCVLNLSQHAYLNIDRADIIYAKDYMVFETPIFYGSDESSLPNIKTRYVENDLEENVFKDIEGNEIELKEINGKNFLFSSSPQSVKTLNASSSRTYSIKVNVYTNNPNYNPLLNVDVQLTISPKEIVLENPLSLEYKGKFQDGKIVYSGHASVFALKVETTTENAIYNNSYIYKKLQIFYENAVNGFLKAYNYDSLTGIVSPTEVKKFISDLTFESIEEKTYGGESYYLINKNSLPFCILVENQDATPKDAGIYLCVATCTAGDNFEFTGNMKTQTHFSIFEISRASNITIDEWQSEFRYGTKFDLENFSTLPFYYIMTPNFKSKVRYSVSDAETWESNNFILPVSSYEITLIIDELNYYLSSSQNFSVISREVQLIFPERTKYSYKGENEPVDLFLNDIYAILKNHDGIAIERKEYNATDTNFDLTFTPQGGSDAIQIPWQAGDYTLTVKYGSPSENYYGEGIFNYTIEMQAFSGSININNKEIEYESSSSAEWLYSQILQMFEIESGYDYLLIVSIDGGKILSASDNSWLSTVNKVGVHKITFKVDFSPEQNISTYIGSATLTITAKKISDANFKIPDNNEQYSYTGNAIHNQLVFSQTVDLSAKILNETVSFTVGLAIYYVKTMAYNQVKVMDSMNNDIFTLTYNYSYETLPGTYTPMVSIPLSSREVNYKVEYVFSDFGQNYSNRLSLNTITRLFKINKLTTLYISIFDTNSNNFNTNLFRDYSGENYRDTLNLESLIGVSNNEQEKNNIKKKMIKAPAHTSSVTYTSTEGVHLLVFYTNSNGLVVTDLSQAGSYHLNISFLRKDNYAVAEFFEYVVFNGSQPYATSQFFQFANASFMDTNHTVFPFLFETYFSIPFTIEQIDCPYNDSNIDGIMIRSQGEYNITTEGGDLYPTTVLIFSADYKFTLKVGSPFNIVFETYASGHYSPITQIDFFYNQGEYFFSNFIAGVEYSFMFVDPDGNYKNGEHIHFRVAATEPE